MEVFCNPYEDLLEAISSSGDSSTINNPYIVVAQVCTFFSVSTFLISTITDNYSQVDKIWSITPIVYTWLCVSDARTLLMASVITIWGLRLTYNFYRRGGYNEFPNIFYGEEDYRWKYVRSGQYVSPLLKNEWIWMAFNLLFVSKFQNVLLLLVTAPSLVAWSCCNGKTQQQQELYDFQTLNWMDAIATVLVLFFILIESIADNQQLAFQNNKKKNNNKNKSENEKKDQGGDEFNQSGLFAIVRKPNYAAEQMIWVSFYLFSIAASGKLINWTSIGSLSLICLFHFSGNLTESISVSKYPAYETQYMKTTPRYVPTISSLFAARKKKGD